MALLSWNSPLRRPRFSERAGVNTTARLVCWLVTGSALSWNAPAFAQADDVKACAEAYEQAQVTRNSGKLKESEEQLRVCVRDVCPDFVKVDCGQWLSDVRREMPSVILMVTDGSGNEVTDVKVALDGTTIAESLDGKAFEINPGPHELTFERQGAKRSERVSIRQGEKNRVIKIELGAQLDTDGDGVRDNEDRCPTEAGELSNAGCPALPAPQPPPAAAQGLSGLQVGAIVAAGVGVLGFGTFAVAGTMSRVNAQDAIKECGEDGNKCTSTQVRTFQDKEALLNPLANVGVIVGGVSMATAVVLFALSLEDNPSETQVGQVGFSVVPTLDGGWISARTRF